VLWSNDTRQLSNELCKSYNVADKIFMIQMLLRQSKFLYMSWFSSCFGRKTRLKLRDTNTNEDKIVTYFEYLNYIVKLNFFGA